MSERIEPTAEDMIIFERNLKRIMRWIRAYTTARKGRLTFSIIEVIKRFTNDYIETGGSK